MCISLAVQDVLAKIFSLFFGGGGGLRVEKLSMLEFIDSF